MIKKVSLKKREERNHQKTAERRPNQAFKSTIGPHRLAPNEIYISATTYAHPNAYPPYLPNHDHVTYVSVFAHQIV